MNERSEEPSAVEAAITARIELRQIEQVLEIVRCGSLTAAARRLGLSQPALSKSLAKLEHELGLRLFDRENGAALPTKYGRLIADRGRLVLGGAAELSKELTHLSNGLSDRLNIGVGPVTRVRPLPQVVKKLFEEHPQVQLVTRQADARRIARGVADGRLDLAFVYSKSADDFGDLLRISIFQSRQVILVRPDHVLAGAETPVGVRELLQHRWASFGLTPHFRHWLGPISAFEERNASAFVCDDTDVLLQTAASQDFMLRGPSFLFESAVRAGTLIELSSSYSSMYECWMLTTADRWRSPLIKAISEYARSPMS